MRFRIILVGVVCLAFIMLPSCAPQPEQQAEPVADEAPSTEADVEAIKAVFKQYEDTITADDFEGYMALFVADCMVLPPNAAILIGKDTWRPWAQSTYFDQFDMEETITVQETKIAGDWAFVRGSYTFQGIPKAEGETTGHDGKFISIVERQSDGSWKISHNIWSSDGPPPEEPTT